MVFAFFPEEPSHVDEKPGTDGKVLFRDLTIETATLQPRGGPLGSGRKTNEKKKNCHPLLLPLPPPASGCC
jgi:hypothetical protein